MSIKLEISDFLGYCDINGTDAVTSEQVERLEDMIYKCNQAMVEGDCIPLVADAIYDRLIEILKAVNPDSDLLHQLWSDASEEINDINTDSDLNELLVKYPMMSICTCKSYECQELNDFISRLPDEGEFDIHTSLKENGHGVRLVYVDGYLEYATSRMRSTGGHIITKQVSKILSKYDVDLNALDSLADESLLEIRGEIVLPFDKLELARTYNSSIVSAFTGVSSMLRDSATEDEWGMLDFVAYKVVSDNISFTTKSEEYAFLADLGFTVPESRIFEAITKDEVRSLIEWSVMPEFEAIIHGNPDEGIAPYPYYTDGVVFEIDNRNLFRALGTDGGKYNYGNVALKIGYWQQDMYMGYIQTILWTDGKTKLSPVAIIGEEPNMALFRNEDTDDLDDVRYYIQDKSEIDNWAELGVVTAGGNHVRRVPLYEPNNMIILDAYVGNPIYFRYGGEAGVVPCTSDGKTLANSKIKQTLSYEDDEDDDCIEYIDLY